MFAKPLENLLEKYKSQKAESVPDTIPKIHVDEIASQVARFYERVRNIIDYREEHLLRKHFIDRTLRRRFFLKGISPNIAEPLIKEIIRAGHLPNDTVPQTKINEVQKAIDTLAFLLDELGKRRDANINELAEWLTHINFPPIKQILFPPTKDAMIADFMFWTIRNRLTISGVALLREEDISLQLFVAIQKALLRVDREKLNYRLLKFVYPQWNTLSHEDAAAIAPGLYETKKKIGEHLKNSLSVDFFKLCNHYNTIFYLIGDVVGEDKSPEELRELLEHEKLL